MMDEPNSLLSRYFDEDLTEAELQELGQLLESDPNFVEQFVAAALLHDQLHGQILARAAMNTRAAISFRAVESASVERPSLDAAAQERVSADSGSQGDGSASLTVPRAELAQDPSLQQNSMLSRRAIALVAIAATLVIAILFSRGGGTVQAGQAELQKLIAANVLGVDRTFAIEVEANVVGGARGGPREPSEFRPPKPPLDGARLYVRAQGMYVLDRKLDERRSFITGCDGMRSWMIPPEGEVRVSRDLNKFNHDVPGHEYSMSLCNLSDALELLRSAFDVTVLPVEYEDAEAGSENLRLLVATRKRGFPGPRRVEITYLEGSRQIEQLRFVDMPYGSDRLTVRVTLVDSSRLSDAFFEHTSHHSADRTVVQD